MKCFLSFLFFAAFFSGLFFVSSCSQEKDDNSFYFDRGAMLAHYYDHLIMPSFADLAQQSSRLREAVDTLLLYPSVPHLLNAQQAWRETAIAFQAVSCFHFGPAEQATGSLLENQGTFPASVNKIEQYILAGDFSLQNFDRDSRGLYGMDYLLFHDSLSALLSEFNQQPARLLYLKAIAQHTETEAAAVYAGWGSHRNEFISATGIDAGSSTSLLYNHFLMAYEHCKNIQLGLPLGLRVGQTQTAPGLVMGLYSGTSLLLLRRQIETLQGVYAGTDAGGNDGIGWDDYLRKISGGESLDQQISERLVAINNLVLLAGEDRMDTMILAGDTRLPAIYSAMQQAIYLVKSEMSSLMGISITYASGDGD